MSEILAPMRTCSRCRTPKPLAAFRLDARGYLRSHCRECSLAVTREWRARHREALLARRRAAYPTREGVHAATSRLLTALALCAYADDSAAFISPTATRLRAPTMHSPKVN